MNVVQKERLFKPLNRKRNGLVRKDTSKGIRTSHVIRPAKMNIFRTFNKTPRYEFNLELSKSKKSSMGPPSAPPPSLKRKLYNSHSTKATSSSSGPSRPRILAYDSEIADRSNLVTPKNRPSALRYISSSSRGGYSGTRSMKSTSASIVDATVILAISEGRGMARGEIGMAAVDLRHPHLVLCQFSDTLLYTHTLTKINYFNPVEIIVPHTFCEGIQPNQLYQLIKEQFPLVNLTSVPRRHFNDSNGRQNLQTLCAPQYSAVCVQVIHKFYALTAAAAVLKYVEYIQCIVFAQESLKIEYHSSEDAMIIDVGTATQLELVQPLVPSAGHTCSLLGVLGPTYTLGGIRALRATILQPSCKNDLIEARLDAVQELMENESSLMVDVQEVLKKLTDIDKILFLCIETSNHNLDKYGEAQLNQTLMLKTTMELVPKLSEGLNAVESGKLRKIKIDLENLNYKEIADRIRNVIREDAHPEKGATGGLQRCFAVKPNINGLLDVARKTYSELIDDIQKIVERLSETYDLPLRLNQNVMKGFHIILPIAPKARRHFNIEDLPPVFIQVVFNGASVTMSTEELVVLDHQAKVSLSDIQKMSNIVIETLLKDLRPFMSSLYTLCEDVAELDILLALVQASAAGSYVRPEFNEYMDVRNSVHPLLEYNSLVPPVPNDIFASPEHNFTIVTGPNMGGKSVYIKQVAVIQIMAQLGCFVPATNAVFRICDRIFSRIGFNDSVELNASTYVIEMKETQHILKALTSSSLVIIDELCRGTCVEEGTSIAWAICEELLTSQAFTFFTTHFAYLTKLQDLYHNVVNRRTAVKEEEISSSGSSEKRLVYRHKVELGVSNVEHYGLALAARTNLPEDTINFAKELAVLISANHKPFIVTSEIPTQDRILYKLNADMQMESRRNTNSKDKIRQIINKFEIENPHIIEKIQRKIVERKETSTISVTHTSPPKNNVSDSIRIAPADLQQPKESKFNNMDVSSYPSVKSSTELLNTFIYINSINNEISNNLDITKNSLNRTVEAANDIDNIKTTRKPLCDYVTKTYDYSSLKGRKNEDNDHNQIMLVNINEKETALNETNIFLKHTNKNYGINYIHKTYEADNCDILEIRDKDDRYHHSSGSTSSDTELFYNYDSDKNKLKSTDGNNNSMIYNKDKSIENSSHYNCNHKTYEFETLSYKNYNETKCSSNDEDGFKANVKDNEYECKNDLNESDSDITEALTQIIEDTVENTMDVSYESFEEDLMRETIREINEEFVSDDTIESIILTPPLSFRDY